MSTAITKTNPQTGLVGDREAIAATVDRIRSMTNVPQDAPDESVWGLAQMCVALDLNPIIGEAYLGKFNGRYSPLVGTMGYEKEARKQSEFQYEVVELDEQELKRHRGELYDPEDVGYRITLWVLKDAKEWTSMGLPYKPINTYGFWMKKAKWNKYDKKWTPDQVPATWTPHMVAEKRAIRNALKRGYSFGGFERRLQELGALTDADEFSGAVYEVVEEEHTKEQRRTAPIAERPEPEEDDGLLVAPRRPKAKQDSPEEEVDFREAEPLADVETLADVEEIPFGEPESDAEDEQAIAEDPMVPYHTLWINPEWGIEDEFNPYFVELRNADKVGEETTVKGYGIAIGQLKKLGVSDELRPMVLAVLFGRTITREVRPTAEATKLLYRWIHPDTGDATFKDLVQNVIPMAINKHIGDDPDPTLWE